MKATSTALEKIPNVIIDSNGIFKYIQIYVRDIFTDESKYVIRGYKKHKFHADNFADFSNSNLIINIILVELPKLEITKSVEYECVGGGRVDVNESDKRIFVYGYSQSYGRCDHQLTCDLLGKVYTDYNITWSNEGY